MLNRCIVSYKCKRNKAKPLAAACCFLLIVYLQGLEKFETAHSPSLENEYFSRR